MSLPVVPDRFPSPVPLTKRDLDREIERLVETVAHGCLPAPSVSDDDELRPRWIRPADLIRCVAPFTSRN